MSGNVMKTMIIALVGITVVGVVALIFVLNMDRDQAAGEGRSIDEVVEASFETEELTTDLKDDRFVRVQFQIVTDNKAAKEELQKREFQLQNILIKELSKMDVKEFKTGISNLESMIKSKLNELMDEGKVTDVYTITKVLQ
ncbi:flagellar basal body protein FliL [Pontibacillus halophilus JSM 076056 = DSM 19796]|uniref:Flagellar protein FliL n=1 Tax=Pontibacillus halophilus JSM 076056 = DSM 19796 TaxID=1385510 RepID=A0A0A5GPS6_9BACI|nr:flagellar basal body-associated protein FliL [Pontibacillus halophilus]KGX93165.1 flagellar basal body protein FliL [Pontibacillus halophilus JSM 076056 = DSM 19796]